LASVMANRWCSRLLSISNVGSSVLWELSGKLHVSVNASGTLSGIHFERQRSPCGAVTFGGFMAATDSRWNAIAIARCFAGSLWVEPPPIF